MIRFFYKQLLFFSLVSSLVYGDGYVALYDLNDSGYTNNLLENNVSIDGSGNYNVTTDDFIDPQRATNGDPFIIRAIYTDPDSGQEYELSFPKLDANETANVTPKTSAAAIQIIETVSENFGSDISDLNLTSIKDQFDNLKENNVSSTNFAIDPNISDAERQEKALLAISQDPVAAKYVTAIKTEVAEQQKEALSTEITSLSKNFDPEAQPEAIARITYSVVSNFAYMGLGVHNGNGKVIAFLPTPPEKLNTLPGVPYSFITYDSVQDKNVTIGGNDPQLRLIDPTKDLVSVTGYEPWAYDIKQKLSDSPVVPFNVIKSFVKNYKETVTLKTFGDILAAIRTPADNDDLWSGINPFNAINGKTLSSTNPEESVQELLAAYGIDLVANRLDFIANDMLNTQMASGDVSNFITLFNGSGTAGDFVDALASDNSDPLAHLANELSVPLMAGIPLSNKDNTNIKFNDAGYTIDVNTTTVTPASAIGLVNLVMSANPFNEASLVKTQMQQAMPWFFGGFTPSELNGEDTTEIWWASYDDTAFAGVSESSLVSWNKNFIVAIANAFTNGDNNIVAESNYANTMSNISSAIGVATEKIEENHYLNEFDTEFFSDFGVNDYVDTSITVKISKFDQQPNTKITGVTFTPIYENVVKGGRVIATDSNISLSLVNGSYKAENIRVYKDSIALDNTGATDPNGEYRQFGMFKVTIFEAGVAYDFGEFPLFPVASNDLGSIYFQADAMYNDDGEEFSATQAGEFEYHEYTIGNSSKNMFYPSFFKASDDERVGEDIMSTSDGYTYTVVTGVGTLTDANITLSKLADNYTAQDDVWQDNNFTHASPITSININSANEGTLYRMSVSSSVIKPAELLINIDWNDGEKVGISIFPVPGTENSAGGGFDFDNIPQDLNLDGNFTTRVKFKLVKWDGITTNYDVSSIIFTPELKADHSLANDKNTTFTNPVNGEFESSITLEPTYSGMFSVTAVVVNSSLEKEYINIGYFPIHANAENDLDKIYYEYYSGDGMYMPATNMAPMHPEASMQTNFAIKIVFDDPQTGTIVPNAGVVTVKVTPILESSTTYVREKATNVNLITELDHTVDGASGLVWLEPFEDKFDSTGASGTTHHYTGEFKVDVVMDDGETLDLGQFVLFATDYNDLGNMFFGGINNFTQGPKFIFDETATPVDTNLTANGSWYSIFEDYGRLVLSEFNATTVNGGATGVLTYREFELDDSNLNECVLQEKIVEDGNYTQDPNDPNTFAFSFVSEVEGNIDGNFTFVKNQVVTGVDMDGVIEPVDFTVSDINTSEFSNDYGHEQFIEQWFRSNDTTNLDTIGNMVKIANGCVVTP